MLVVNVAAIEAMTPCSMSLQISQIGDRCLNMLSATLAQILSNIVPLATSSIFCLNIAKYCSQRSSPLCTLIYLCLLLTCALCKASTIPCVLYVYNYTIQIQIQLVYVSAGRGIRIHPLHTPPKVPWDKQHQVDQLFPQPITKRGRYVILKNTPLFPLTKQGWGYISHMGLFIQKSIYNKFMTTSLQLATLYDKQGQNKAELCEDKKEDKLSNDHQKQQRTTLRTIQTQSTKTKKKIN